MDPADLYRDMQGRSIGATFELSAIDICYIFWFNIAIVNKAATLNLSRSASAYIILLIDRCVSLAACNESFFATAIQTISEWLSHRPLENNTQKPFPCYCWVLLSMKGLTDWMATRRKPPLEVFVRSPSNQWLIPELTSTVTVLLWHEPSFSILFHFGITQKQKAKGPIRVELTF